MIFKRNSTIDSFSTIEAELRFGHLTDGIFSYCITYFTSVMPDSWLKGSFAFWFTSNFQHLSLNCASKNTLSEWMHGGIPASS